MDKFTQDPDETLDYDIDASALVTDGDSIIATTCSESTETLSLSVYNGDTSTPKVWVSGGVHGETYQVTCRLTTNNGRIKEHDFKVKIKEV